MLAFTARSLFSPIDVLDRPLVLVEDGAIVSLGSLATSEIPSKVAVVNFDNCILAPGLVDIHIHGAAGYDVMQPDAHAKRGMEQFLARHGVTSYYPTTVTAPLAVIQAAVERLANSIEEAGKSFAGAYPQPLGIHLEGPFLSHARRGVHPPEDLLAPSINLFEKLWQTARGHIRLMTIAPELDCALEVIAEASKRGVCVSLGHSDADLSTARKGAAAGARHATHTFNAMRPLDHREPGILGAVLTDSRLTADVIADGIHVDSIMVELLVKLKGIENIVLITDGISATGMPDGRYRLGSLEVELKQGKCLRDGKLAGSVLTMDRALKNCMEFAKLDLHQCLRTATLNPAQVADAPNKGTLQVGADADFVVLTDEGELRATIVRGVV